MNLTPAEDYLKIGCLVRGAKLTNEQREQILVAMIRQIQADALRAVESDMKRLGMSGIYRAQLRDLVNQLHPIREETPNPKGR